MAAIFGVLKIILKFIIGCRFPEHGSYNVSDINEIVNNNIQEQFNITELPVILTKDVNRYSILIIVKKDWEVRLN